MLRKIIVSIFISSLATILATDKCENMDWERCYNPVFWAKNYNGNASKVQSEELHFLQSKSAEVRNAIPHESNVRYGSRERATMDIYGGDVLPPDAPIFVYIFGGCWNGRNNTFVSLIAKPLFEAGIRVVIPNYDLLPQVNLDTQTQGLREMADFVLSLAEKNSSRGVWFGGPSSAGHMTAELMFDDYLITVNETRRKLIRGFFPISGIYDVTAITHLQLNNHIHITREEAERHSPLLKVNQLSIASSSKMIVVLAMAEFDPPGIRITAMKMLQYLMNNGIHVRFIYIPDEDHYSENYNLYYSDYELTRAIISQIKS